MNAPTPATGLTPEQHLARAGAVGASEVYDALFNPPELWLRKTGREPPIDDSPLLRLGNAIEPYIIGEYLRERGDPIVHWKPNTRRLGRMVAHLDAIVEHPTMGERAVEAKWRGSRDEWGEAGTDEVPQPILLQATAQMHVTTIKAADIPVLFLRPPIVIFTVPYDDELGTMIEDGVKRFWWHVEHDVAPAVDAAQPEALAVLRKLYPGTDGSRIIATKELDSWRDVFEGAMDSAKKFKQTGETAKAHLLAAMGKASELQFTDGKVLRRKLVPRAGYTVAPTEYVDARIVNPRSK